MKKKKSKDFINPQPLLLHGVLLSLFLLYTIARTPSSENKIKQVFSTFFVELHKKQDVKSMFLMKKYVVSTQLFVEFSRNLRFLFPQPAYNSPIPWEN